MTNEAAERLRHDGYLRLSNERLNEILAAERRATVERIRERLDREGHYYEEESEGCLPISRILDEEAAR